MSKNAKFEEWFEEDGQYETDVLGASGAGWQAAIQSLEVTPRLVQVYCAAVNEHLGSLTKKQWVLERTDPVGSIERAATIGLTAVFNAIKEQAK